MTPIPDRWFWIGHRQGEWILTFRLPWRRKMYQIHTDSMVIGYPRFGMRIRFGWSVDRAREVVELHGVSDPFAPPANHSGTVDG